MMLRQALLNLLSHALRVVRGNLVLTVTHSNDGGQIDLRESATTIAPVPVRSDDIEQTDIGLAVARH